MIAMGLSDCLKDFLSEDVHRESPILAAVWFREALIQDFPDDVQPREFRDHLVRAVEDYRHEPKAELLIRLLTEAVTYYRWYSNPEGRALTIQDGQFVIIDHGVSPPGAAQVG